MEAEACEFVHLPQQQLSCSEIPGGTSHLARTEPLTDGTEPRAQQEGLGDGSRRLEALSGEIMQGEGRGHRHEYSPCHFRNRIPNHQAPASPGFLICKMGMTVQGSFDEERGLYKGSYFAAVMIIIPVSYGDRWKYISEDPSTTSSLGPHQACVEKKGASGAREPLAASHPRLTMAKPSGSATDPVTHWCSNQL